MDLGAELDLDVGTLGQDASVGSSVFIRAPNTCISMNFLSYLSILNPAVASVFWKISTNRLYHAEFPGLLGSAC